MPNDTSAHHSGSVVGPAAMVGRDAERALLHEQLQMLAAGQGQLVILGGEAGIGKTTLARDLIARARQRGYGVLVGRSFDLVSASPYSLWLDLATYYERTRTAGAGPDLPQVLADRNLGEIRSQSAFFDSVRLFFDAIAGAQPCVIVLEDVHWADPASLDLLRYIASGVALSRLLLVVTYRVDELTQHYAFYRHLPSLVRESDGMRLDLKQLPTAGLRGLVASRYALPAADIERLTRYLDVRSEGNPFFAVELLHSLEDAAAPGLVKIGDSWRLGELDTVVVPDLVRQVIDIRIERLGSEMREPLALAAVIGQEVSRWNSGQRYRVWKRK